MTPKVHSGANVPGRQLSILGSKIKVLRVEQEAVTIRGEIRLCAGRKVTLRADGTQMSELTVLSSHVCELHANRVVYQVRCSSNKPLETMLMDGASEPHEVQRVA